MCRACPTLLNGGEIARAWLKQLSLFVLRMVISSALFAYRFPDFVDVELHDEIEAAGDQRAGVIAKNSLHGKRNSLCKV